jgi:hypothetical protein
MKVVLRNYVYTALGIAILASSSTITQAFTTTFSRRTFVSKQTNANVNIENSLTELNAKKKKKALVTNIDFDAFDDDEPMSKKDQLKAQKAAKKEAAAPKLDAKAAALAALDSLDFDDDEPMSAKEKAKLEKQKKKEAKKQQAAANSGAPPGKDKKKAAALKALEEMERLEAQMAANGADDNVDEFGMPKKKLSKKEMKALKKKEEKEAAKRAAKEAKEAAKRAAASEAEEGVPAVAANGEAVVSSYKNAHVVSISSF